jgi:hypothetical protein
LHTKHWSILPVSAYDFTIGPGFHHRLPSGLKEKDPDFRWKTFTDSEKAVRSWVEKEKARTNSEKRLGAGGSPAHPSPTPEGGDVTPDTFADKQNILPGDEEIKPELKQRRRSIPSADSFLEEPISLEHIREYDDLWCLERTRRNNQNVTRRAEYRLTFVAMKLMEMKGFEPSASDLRSLRSPN